MNDDARPEGHPPERPDGRTATPQERLLLLDLWQQSGLSPRDFGALVDVSNLTLFGWREGYKPGAPEPRARNVLLALRRARIGYAQGHPEPAAFGRRVEGWQVKSIEGVMGDNGTWWSFTVVAAPEPQPGDAAPPAPDEQAEAEAGPIDRAPAPVDLRRRESVARRRRPRRDRRSPVTARILDSGVSWRPTAGGVRAGLLGLLLVVALLVPRAAQAQAGVIIEYYHLDALGTVRAVTDAGGNLVRSHDFKPFGEEVRDAQGQVQLGDRKLFTGQERDTETGLDYFGARYYRPQVGRFMTLDRVYRWKEDCADPQRWNRYSYVRNNPLHLVDPNGLWAEDVHRVLTTALAYAAGFSPENAADIGAADQITDEDPRTEPYNWPRSSRYHFSWDWELRDLWHRANQSGSYEDFGSALHAYQDSFVHPASALGAGVMHWQYLKLHSSFDFTWEHPQAALKMAEATYAVLRMAAPAGGPMPVPWELLEPLVKKWISEKDPKKRNAILDNIYVLVDFMR